MSFREGAAIAMVLTATCVAGTQRPRSLWAGSAPQVLCVPAPGLGPWDGLKKPLDTLRPIMGPSFDLGSTRCPGDRGHVSCLEGSFKAFCFFLLPCLSTEPAQRSSPPPPSASPTILPCHHRHRWEQPGHPAGRILLAPPQMRKRRLGTVWEGSHSL